MSEVGHYHHSIPALRRVCILAYSLMNYYHAWRKKCIGKKPLVRYRHTFYFIDTEIYTLKYYRVLSFVSLIGQTMYFHRRSPPIFELKFGKKLKFVWNKNIIPWKVFERFYSPVAMHQKTHSFAALARWYFWCFAAREWNNHYSLLQNSHDASGDESLNSHG